MKTKHRLLSLLMLGAIIALLAYSAWARHNQLSSQQMSFSNLSSNQNNNQLKAHMRDALISKLNTRASNHELRIATYAQSPSHPQLSTQQLSFNSYLSTNNNNMLTAQMWDNLTTQFGNTISNHEMRLRCIEDGSCLNTSHCPTTPSNPSPPEPTNWCSLQQVQTAITQLQIKFTHFSGIKNLHNGEEQTLIAQAYTTQIKNSSYPHGHAPTHTIRLRCQNQSITILQHQTTCPTTMTYHATLGSCGKGCQQEQLGNPETDLDPSEYFEHPTRSQPKRKWCPMVEGRLVEHGGSIMKPWPGFLYNNHYNSEPCFKEFICDNGHQIQKT